MLFPPPLRGEMGRLTAALRLISVDLRSHLFSLPPHSLLMKRRNLSANSMPLPAAGDGNFVGHRREHALIIPEEEVIRCVPVKAYFLSTRSASPLFHRFFLSLSYSSHFIYIYILIWGRQELCGNNFSWVVGIKR